MNCFDCGTEIDWIGPALWSDADPQTRICWWCYHMISKRNRADNRRATNEGENIMGDEAKPNKGGRVKNQWWLAKADAEGWVLHGDDIYPTKEAAIAAMSPEQKLATLNGELLILKGHLTPDPIRLA